MESYLAVTRVIFFCVGLRSKVTFFGDCLTFKWSGTSKKTLKGGIPDFIVKVKHISRQSGNEAFVAMFCRSTLSILLAFKNFIPICAVP